MCCLHWWCLGIWYWPWNKTQVLWDEGYASLSLSELWLQGGNKKAEPVNIFSKAFVNVWEGLVIFFIMKMLSLKMILVNIMFMIKIFPDEECGFILKSSHPESMNIIARIHSTSYCQHLIIHTHTRNFSLIG